MPTPNEVIGDMKLNDFYLTGTNGNSAWNTGGNIQIGADLRGEAVPTWWNSANQYFGYWNALLPWFVVWDGANHQSNLNIGVWVKKHELYTLDPAGVWTQRQNTTNIGGSFFPRGLEGGQQATDGEQYKPTEGGLIFKQQAGQQVFHGWGEWCSINGSQVRGVHSRLVVCLIRYDQFQPQQSFNLAELSIQCGCDGYPSVGMNTNAFAPAYYAIASGASRFRKIPQTTGAIVGASIRGSEMTVSYTNLSTAYSVDYSSKAGKQAYFVMSDAAFLANMPPGVSVGGPAPANPPPVPPPATAGSFGRITMAGDSLFRGNTIDAIPPFFSPNQKLDQLLTGGGWAHQWVGSRDALNGQTATPGSFPTSSQGGWTVQDLINDLPNVNTADPHTIIVEYGTNGLDIAATKTPEYLNGLRAVLPEADRRIYVCCPFNPGWFDTAQFNALRAAMVSWCSGGPGRYFIDLNDAAPLTLTDGTHWTSGDADKIASLLYARMAASMVTSPPPPSSPPPPPSTPPPPPPPPVVQGRKTIWIAGDSLGSVEDGTLSGPINTYAKLVSAITTYGPTGVDLRMKAGAIWTGTLPSEIVHYPGTTLKGDDWLSGLGHFEGGVRKTDWTTLAGAPGGKQLWKCTTLTNQSLTAGTLQPGAVSVDDAIVANRKWRGSIGATVPFMDDFDLSSSYDSASNIMYLMLPTGTNPNNVVTMVAQNAFCLSNQTFAAAGNRRTGIVLQHLRFKRYSYKALALANLPAVFASNIYGKHIGGRYSDTQFLEGYFLELAGGCDKFVVSNIKGDGIDTAVVSSRVGTTFPNQPAGTISNVTGSHIGFAVVVASLDAVSGCTMDNLLVEDATGTAIGDFTAAGRRPDRLAAGVFAGLSTALTGTSSMNAAVFRRCVAVDSPLGFVDQAHVTAGRQVYFEACQGKVNPALTIEAALQFSHLQSGTGVDQFIFRGCALQGYQSAIKHEGGQHSFAVEVTNCVFVDNDIAAIDMNGVPNTALTVRNCVAHNSVQLVRAINGAGSSVDNQGGNYVSTGTALGMTAVGSDDVNQANPGFVGSAVGKPPNASILYSGGVSLGSLVLNDRLGQLFQSPWSQGAYAKYSASDGIVGGALPVPGGSSGVSVWENRLTSGGFIAYLAQQTAGVSQVTGITNVPASLSIVVNQLYYLVPAVSGTGDYSQAIIYELIEGTAASVLQNGQIKGLSVGTARIRVKSFQVPTIFVDVVVFVNNYTEVSITAAPSPLPLTMVGGPQTILITAAGRPQAGVFAISTNSLVATASERSAFDGTILVTPVGVGNCTIQVTKNSRAGGQQTIQVPVLVTLGTQAGDVTAIETEDAVLVVDQPFYQMILDDQNGNPIARQISVTVNPPYVRTAHTLVNGALNLYPVGVGICLLTLELVNSVGLRITRTVRVEVIPIGGAATPAPPPPPPISGNPED